VLQSSWNWELISDKTLDWWVPAPRPHQEGLPDRVLIASIMAGSGSDKEMKNWQTLAKACQAEGADGLELNLSCPHMDREDMGSNIGKDQKLCSFVTQVVKEVAKVPVWAKLHAGQQRHRAGGGCRLHRRRRRGRLVEHVALAPAHRPESLEFEMNVDGLVSSGGLGGPSILPLSMAKMSQMTRAFPEKSFSGIGGIADFPTALNYFLLGCGTVQVCTAAMLDHAIGPNVIKSLIQGMRTFLEKNASRGWTKLEDFRGLRRERIVGHSQIRRPADSDYQGRYERRGYAQPLKA
jgi:dihydroorotate dehydrogenase